MRHFRGENRFRAKSSGAGLCGDVYLVGSPAGCAPRRCESEHVSTKVGDNIRGGAPGPGGDASYALRAQVSDNGRSVGDFTSKAFRRPISRIGWISFTESWKPEKLWDTTLRKTCTISGPPSWMAGQGFGCRPA